MRKINFTALDCHFLIYYCLSEGELFKHLSYAFFMINLVIPPSPFRSGQVK